MLCGLARCPGAKSSRLSIIPVVSFTHVHAISSSFNVILLIYHLAAGYPLCHHNTLDIEENIAWAIIIFHAFSAFRKSFVPFKTRARDMQSSP
jgi:hypothetical protein